MSPEQARGKTVDKRADIWAFGCILYELLTVAAPFTAPFHIRHTRLHSRTAAELGAVAAGNSRSGEPRPQEVLGKRRQASYP
jgi:serine/threonine protein kinase